MYLKRQKIAQFWPIPRKGTKYLAVPSHEKSESVPLVVIVRDVLKIIRNSKEIKALLNENKILVNGRVVKEKNYPILLFDSLSFPSIKKYYRTTLIYKKFGLEEISEKEAVSRIYKVIGKKQLKDKKTQINLNGGKNILSSEKFKVGDFVIAGNLDNKIIKTIPLKKETKVIVVKGKHIGIRGKIKEIRKEGENEVAEISTEKKSGESVKVNIRNLFVTE